MHELMAIHALYDNKVSDKKKKKKIVLLSQK